MKIEKKQFQELSKLNNKETALNFMKRAANTGVSHITENLGNLKTLSNASYRMQDQDNSS